MGFHELGFSQNRRGPTVGNKAAFFERINARPTGGCRILQQGKIMSPTNRIRILVLHRDPVAQAGLSVAFRGHSDFEVQEIHDPVDRDRLFSEPPYSTDVVVTDYSEGVQLAKEMARRGNMMPGLKIVVVARIDREWEIRSALAESISLEPLTSREEEVLRLVVEGLCNKAIGRRLGIAVGTVKPHLKSTFDKLRVESRTQAVAVVERWGLLCQPQDAVHGNVNLKCTPAERQFNRPARVPGDGHPGYAMPV
jgi:DNA-binding CsgD family transcriptional regulator